MNTSLYIYCPLKKYTFIFVKVSSYPHLPPFLLGSLFVVMSTLYIEYETLINVLYRYYFHSVEYLFKDQICTSEPVGIILRHSDCRIDQWATQFSLIVWWSPEDAPESLDISIVVLPTTHLSIPFLKGNYCFVLFY